jgi:hypothetical protein
MATREQIALELIAREAKTVIEMLHRTIVDFDSVERGLQEAERRAGLDVAPRLPIIERMARLGFSERTRHTVKQMLAAFYEVKNGRPMPASALAMIAERRAASESADRQLAAIVDARRKSASSC